MDQELHNAATQDPKKLQDLLDFGNTYATKQLASACFCAIVAKKQESMKILLAHGAPVSKHAVIAADGDPVIFQEFLNHGWDLNSAESGIYAPSYNTHKPESLKWLFEHETDPNTDKHCRDAICLLKCALSCQNSTETLELIISQGAELDTDILYETMSLNRELSIGRIEMMKVLINCGVDLNARITPSRRVASCSLLHYAVALEDKEVLEILLDAGANHKLVDSNGLIPADYARKHDREEIYKIFVRRGLA